MADGPDPLGKRLLFWVPPGEAADPDGQRGEPSDPAGTLLRRRQRATPRPDSGKRALFSGSGPSGGATSLPAGTSGPDVAGGEASSGLASAGVTTAGPSPGAPSGGDGGPAGDGPARGGGPFPWPASLPGGGLFRRIAPVEIACATCGKTSTVDVVRFAALHVPVFVWRPGRGYTRLMTCPACRRRSWISASWPARRDGATDPGDA